MLQSKQDIINTIKQDEYMMTILSTVQKLQLPDWWICAGFVRSKIWDVLHQYELRTPTDDVDVVYFDPLHMEEAVEKEYEQKLKEMIPKVPWSVKNEARMHLANGLEPYTDTVDAIAKFPETVTSLGIKLTNSGELILTSPHGIEDVLHMTVRPTPYFSESEERMEVYHHRIRTKKWEEKWPKVKTLL